MTAEELGKADPHFFDALNSESPLPCVLVAVSQLEQALGNLLGEFLLPCEETNHMLQEIGNNPLGSFGSRASMAYCLNLLPETEFKNLKAIAKVRNCFAHSPVPIDFDNPEVISEVDRIQLPKFDGVPPDHQIWGMPTARTRFTMGALLAKMHISLEMLKLQILQFGPRYKRKGMASQQDESPGEALPNAAERI